jgi:hypothetical protein
VKPAALVLLALVALPVIEVALHFRARANVPAQQDWQQAAAFVRTQLQPKDLIVSAPRWTDPRLRAVLGDQIGPAMAGRSDTAAYDRLWSLSIRGERPKEAGLRPPELTRTFGRVTVQLFRLDTANVVDSFDRREVVTLDLVDRVARGEAEVAAGARPCEHKRGPLPRGGGLGQGVLPPEHRFQCDGATWVASVVMEDLSITPRYCVHQPPGVGKPTRVVLRDIALGNRLVLYAGLYYEHERMRKGPPVVATVSANDKPIGRLTHHDGDGWERLEIATIPGTADLAIEVLSTSRKQRAFCWAASVRDEVKP